MKFNWIKRYLPRSLFGRALLILVVPIVSLQVVVTIVFVERHFAGVTAQMADAVAQELAYAVETADAAENNEQAQARLRALAIPLGLNLVLDPGAGLDDPAPRRFYDVSGGAVAETFSARLEQPISVDLNSEEKFIGVQLQSEKGVISARIPRRRLVASNPRLLLFWMLSSSVVLTFVAVLFLRNQIRPIRMLAAASEDFGKGRSLRFRPAGAEEVRRAGAAFLSMRARIERHVEQRTSMLAGVSHDLRTPLTRMKLMIAMSDDEALVQDLGRDVDEMETMLEGFLAFARGEGGEETVPTDPITLAEDVGADAARSGRDIAVSCISDTPEAPLVPLRPIAVRRAVQNLVNNALMYADTVALSVRLLPKSLEILVEDDGPGIPEAKRETALRPFVRLDEARNQDKGGGVGLGLAIAMDVARSHGGALELGESTRLGGLRAVLRIPR